MPWYNWFMLGWVVGIVYCGLLYAVTRWHILRKIHH